MTFYAQLTIYVIVDFLNSSIQLVQKSNTNAFLSLYFQSRWLYNSSFDSLVAKHFFTFSAELSCLCTY